MANEPNFDDIDLDASEEDELQKLEAQEAEEVETEEEAEEELEEATEAEEEEPAIDPQAAVKAQLEELRLERLKLQEQLNELSASSLSDKRKMLELEAALKNSAAQEAQAAQEEEQGPDPRAILAHLDKRIAEVDNALAKAEASGSDKVPEIRRQLRTLERYYNNYVTQLGLMAQAEEKVDPEVVVQQAVLETNQQNRFSSMRSQVIQEFPILDPKSKYFDEDLRDEVHAVYNPMIQAGMDPADALFKTVGLVTRARGIKSISELIAEQQEGEGKKPAPKSAEKAQARKKDTVAKNVAAAAAQPPNIANAGKSGESRGVLDKYDFSSMSINEMMRIPDEDLDLYESTLAMWDGDR